MRLQLAFLFWTGAAAFVAQGGQAPTAAPVKAEAPATPGLSHTEMELFLKTAAVKSQKVLETGVTRASRATLSDGRLTHDAQLQFVDVYKPVFRGKNGTIEKHFRDSYKFNIAAYRLARMLGVDMLPVSVEREFDGKPAAVTWWVDNVWMTEEQRRDKQIKPPTAQFWLDQLNIVRVFDQLIYNTDRNQGNLLITPQWRLWMIDHTRAFRAKPELLKAEALTRVDQKLLEGMRKLNRNDVTRELGPYLRPEEIAGLLARRNLIVEFFDSAIATKGVDEVLSGLPRKTPEVSIP